ncbi:DMT family transporter [Minwuia sp.]|uniref:DMT family transporter n=1 Tax=Minwuia sp. TaxID=2493630 RepID=UPI003A95977D
MSAPANSTAPAASGPVVTLLMPVLFVFLWSTGFIGAKLGLPHAEPLTFLVMRFALVVLGLGIFCLIVRAPWPKRWQDWAHIALVGVMLHAIYLGGVFVSISLGVEAGTSALIVAIQPLLVALLAAPVLGETVTTRQWIGFVLGIAGVTLVVFRKLELGLGTPVGMGFSVLALVGITIGTLYQKRYCGAMDLRTGNVIQFTAAGLSLSVMAFLFETGTVDWTPEFIFALGWLVIVLSFGATTLLLILIRSGAASKVSSLFFLVPAVAALIAWPLFGETFGPLAIAGMALVTIGVALVTLGTGKSRPPARPAVRS